MYDLDDKDDEKISKFHFIKKIIVHTDPFYTSLSRKFKRVHVMKIGGKTTTIISIPTTRVLEVIIQETSFN